MEMSIGQVAELGLSYTPLYSVHIIGLEMEGYPFESGHRTLLTFLLNATTKSYNRDRLINST